MRKVRSAPQLAGMEAKITAASGAAAGSPRHLVAGAAGLQMQGFHLKATPKTSSAIASAVRSRGSAASLRRSSSPRHGLKALMIDAPLALPPYDSTQSILAEAIEQADELIEEFVWARGLIPAGECFEQFGWTESAPPLKDVRQPVNDDQRRALASCLATPFMYDDEHLTKHLQDRVSKTSQENNRNLTNRFVEEVREQQLKEDEKETSSYAGQQASGKMRRRRRGNQAVYLDQIQASAPPLAGRSPSPNTHRVLSRTLSSLEDDSNKLHFDESAMAEKKNVANVTSSIDPACVNMDLPDAALFSLDEPAKSTDDPQLAPGGVLEVSMNDNMLAAEQQSHAPEMEDIHDWDSLRQAIVHEISPDNMSKAENDEVKAGASGKEGMTDASLQKSAIEKAAQNKSVLQDASAADLQASPKGNVVPFNRQRAPRL